MVCPACTQSRRPAQRETVRVTLKNPRMLRVFGETTGMEYYFSPARPTVNADARDAAAMLREKDFVVAETPH